MAKHQAEQPDNPIGAGIVGKLHHEARKVDLGLNAWRCLKPHLIGLWSVLRSGRRQEALYRRISADIAKLANLACQPRRTEIRESGDPLAQKSHEGSELTRSANRPR